MAKVSDPAVGGKRILQRTAAHAWWLALPIGAVIWAEQLRTDAASLIRPAAALLGLVAALLELG